MDADVLRFFDKMPKALPLYEAFVNKLCSEFDDVTIKVQKTQISFSNTHDFAFVWLPIRKVKGRPDIYIVVSFGLDYQVKDSRIEEVTEPYPKRWTHHVIIQSDSEIDQQLMEWIKQAYSFSLTK
ncbi:hypothetical protein Desdi_0744 [Desulfitobacterium dichloroeliminans LMG P-21439]|uniref:DUF5655 domain-containing protein n=1 Tax=Desulfitobacterium dichloroeliminans (strain LMG P-21439 / DCA1) TaxID=871963 RepID=L0F6I7_DESDL|nr:DUF5655 domain-containing protein [Desulfitobacterium dichloroeliminans]AGA68271.1 hypothetical protein Desdi_0744 [Desulfitobacterium dichloroeliminans LMG P-21439]